MIDRCKNTNIFFIPQGVPRKKFQKTLENYSYLFRQHFRKTIDNGFIFAQYLENKNDISAAWCEYQSLPDNEWRKDFFCPEIGGFVATHKYKKKDDLRRPGIAAEVKACYDLAKMGKHILRLPENIPDLIDEITIAGKPYRGLLKFKLGETNPRGYPDAYFDGRTWDFKTASFKNEDTLRHRIKDGRKANNVIFITNSIEHIKALEKAINREIGKRKEDGSWMELPNVYSFEKELVLIWEKR